MNIRDIGDFCIVDVCKDTISRADVLKLKKIFKRKEHVKRLGFDMCSVRYVECEFYSFIKDWYKERNTKVSLFNAEVPVFLQFYTSNVDTWVNVYLDKNDFFADKRVIVRRRLKLLKSA